MRIEDMRPEDFDGRTIIDAAQDAVRAHIAAKAQQPAAHRRAS
jgi:hypothetical protein